MPAKENVPPQAEQRNLSRYYFVGFLFYLLLFFKNKKLRRLNNGDVLTDLGSEDK